MNTFGLPYFGSRFDQLFIEFGATDGHLFFGRSKNNSSEKRRNSRFQIRDALFKTGTRVHDFPLFRSAAGPKQNCFEQI